MDDSPSWEHVTIEEIAAKTPNSMATGPFGSAISARFFQDSGVPVIRGGNLSEDVGKRLIPDDMVFVSQEKAREFQRSKVVQGDLVFTCWGTIGQVGYIDASAPYPEFIVSNKQMKLTPNPVLADSRFLYYLMSGPQVSDQIRGLGIGSSVPGFNLGALKSIKIPLPPLPEQRAIAHILGTLDDKIELNRQMNQTLEEIAAALFRSWFIDFDPVRAKIAGWAPEGMDAATAALFPERLVESEVGEIPEGWRAGTLGDISVAARQLVNPSRMPDQLFSHYSLPAFDAGRLPVTEPGAAIKSNKLVVPTEAVLVSKLNPHIPRVWLPAERSEHPRVASTEYVVLEPASSGYLPFVYAAVSSGAFIAGLQGMVTGTTGSHQRVPPQAILAMPLVMPPVNVIDAYAAKAKPFLARAHAAQNESVTLAAMRDALLPRLLSGKLQVPETSIEPQ